jgi:hypothetical protein
MIGSPLFREWDSASTRKNNMCSTLDGRDGHRDRDGTSESLVWAISWAEAAGACDLRWLTLSSTRSLRKA